MSLLLPGFLLAGLALAAVPLAIHWWNRRRYRVVDFAAMQFLMAAISQNRRRLQLREMLLLAARVAALALMGLALARPVSCSRDGLFGYGGQAATLHVLVMDDTYSMLAETGAGGGTSAERSRQLALELLGRMRQGVDEVAVVTVARPARVVLGVTYDLEQAKSAVRGLKVRQTEGDLSGAIEVATQLLTGEKAVPRKRMYVFSDLTAGTWLPAGAGTGGKSQRDALGLALANAQRSASGGVDVVATPRVSGAHVALTDVVVTEAGREAFGASGGGGTGLLSASTPLAVHVAARATRPDMAESALPAVDVLVDGKVVQAGGGAVKLKPSGEGAYTAEIPVGVLAAGQHVLSARLRGAELADPLTVDQVRSVVVEVPGRVGVLMVEGDRGGDSRPSSGSFVALALAPAAGEGISGSLKRAGPFAVETVADISLPTARLEEYAVVVLADVTPPDDATVRRLEQFVADGGLVVNLLGERFAPMVGKPAGAWGMASLLPGRVTGLVQAEGTEKSAGGGMIAFSPTGNVHPLLSAFAGVQRTGLDTTPVFKHWRLDLKGGGEKAGGGAMAGAAGVILELLSDAAGVKDPLLVVDRRGAGAIITSTVPLGGEEWTTLQARPAFVPLVQELVRNALPDVSYRWNVVTGESVGLLRTDRVVGAAALVGPEPSNQRMEFAQVAGAEGSATQPAEKAGVTPQRWVARSEVLGEAGVYAVEGMAEPRRVAVNLRVWPESDLRAVGEAEIRGTVPGAAGATTLRFHANQAPDVMERGPGGGGAGGVDWTAWLLVLVIGFLALESWLAGGSRGLAA